MRRPKGDSALDTSYPFDPDVSGSYLRDYELWSIDCISTRRLSFTADGACLGTSSARFSSTSRERHHEHHTTGKAVPRDPKHKIRLHFALRAAHCAISSFRPLSPNELFAATTTQVFAEDPPWPSAASTDAVSALRLIRLCSRFLRLSKGR